MADLTLLIKVEDNDFLDNQMMSLRNCVSGVGEVVDRLMMILREKDEQALSLAIFELVAKAGEHAEKIEMQLFKMGLTT